MTATAPAPAVPSAPAQPAPQLAAGRHHHADADQGTWTVARRLPRTLARATALGWRTDRTAVLALAAAQLTAAALTATALSATTTVLGALTTTHTTSALRHHLTAIVLLATATLARYTATAAARAAANRLAPQAVREADLAVIAAATRAELIAYEDPTFEDARGAACDGAQKAADLVQDSGQLTTAAAQLAAAAFILATTDLTVLPLLLLTVLPCAWAAVRAARIEHDAHHQSVSDQRLRSVWREYTTDRGNADEVRAGTMATFLTDQYRQVSRRLEDRQRTAFRRALIIQGTGDLLAGAGTAATWAALALLVATGRLSLAQAGTAVLAVRTADATLSVLVRASARLFRTSLALDDWTHFLTLAQQWATHRGTTTIATSGPDRITARTVSFTYPGADHPALDAIDLQLRRGEVVALVGENGSGKTTLAKILTGLYLPTTGTVHWDQVDLADACPDSVMARLSVVPQDYTRWPLDARQNITLGQPRPKGDAAVHAAAQAAGADTVIAELPHGLDTSLARAWWGGHDLSGGQWQRIAVARSFHRDGSVLVMDEPTAAMDARAEHGVFQRLKTLAAGRTTIFITHRLANTRLADRIVVLNHGRITQTGTYQQLSTTPGEFFDLLNLQEGVTDSVSVPVGSAGRQ